MTVETREKGETIVREGEHGDRYYLIGSGVAEVYKGGVYQEELYFGEGFGRISSFFGRPVDQTVRAKTELELYVLSEPDFQRVLETDKTFESRVRSLLDGDEPGPVRRPATPASVTLPIRLRRSPRAGRGRRWRRRACGCPR